MSANLPEIAPGVTVDRQEGFGRPLIKGTSVTVETVLDEIASGADQKLLQRQFGLSKGGLLAALAYGARLVADEPSARGLDAPDEVSPGVTGDSRVRFGKPVLKGTRLDAASVLGYLASGESVESLAQEFHVTPEAIRDAVRYAHSIVAREMVSAHPLLHRRVSTTLAGRGTA